MTGIIQTCKEYFPVKEALNTERDKTRFGFELVASISGALATNKRLRQRMKNMFRKTAWQRFKKKFKKQTKMGKIKLIATETLSISWDVLTHTLACYKLGKLLKSTNS